MKRSFPGQLNDVFTQVCFDRFYPLRLQSFVQTPISSESIDLLLTTISIPRLAATETT